MLNISFGVWIDTFSCLRKCCSILSYLQLQVRLSCPLPPKDFSEQTVLWSFFSGFIYTWKLLGCKQIIKTGLLSPLFPSHHSSCSLILYNSFVLVLVQAHKTPRHCFYLSSVLRKSVNYLEFLNNAFCLVWKAILLIFPQTLPSLSTGLTLCCFFMVPK